MNIGYKKIIKYSMNFLKTSIIAHRGLHSERIPENTLTSFSKALSKKYSIELDIHILKDDTIVVYHDYNLNRLTGKNKQIENLTFEELKKIKIKNRYKIPTLKEVLNLVNGSVGIIIEVKDKDNNTKFEKLLLKELENYNGNIAIKSFNPYVIKNLNKLKCKYPTGLLINDKVSMNIFKKIYYKHLKIDFLSINVKKNINYKNNKYLTLGWTVRSEKEYLKYKDTYDNLICEKFI